MGKELFKNIPSKVGDLVKDVRNGRIGLPDLQRPFVWRDNKVRELFDSMLKGYPIGYIMLWESPVDYESKKSTIGDNSKTYEEPKELVIDGQQRLTALVAAMFSVKVKDKNFADREIKISYNPLTREFAVWSQAYAYLIRRLTPLECERLQGFPDSWTDIPGASDSARYKALGNSVAIPCVEFIMARIAAALRAV